MLGHRPARAGQHATHAFEVRRPKGRYHPCRRLRKRDPKVPERQRLLCLFTGNIKPPRRGRGHKHVPLQRPRRSGRGLEQIRRGQDLRPRHRRPLHTERRGPGHGQAHPAKPSSHTGPRARVLPLLLSQDWRPPSGHGDKLLLRVSVSALHGRVCLDNVRRRMGHGGKPERACCRALPFRPSGPLFTSR